VPDAGRHSLPYKCIELVLLLQQPVQDKWWQLPSEVDPALLRRVPGQCRLVHLDVGETAARNISGRVLVLRGAEKAGRPAFIPRQSLNLLQCTKSALS
jgi:hypothetical protein